MSTASEQNQQSNSSPEQGADVESMHTKVADLLDNVTVLSNQTVRREQGTKSGGPTAPRGESTSGDAQTHAGRPEQVQESAGGPAGDSQDTTLGTSDGKDGHVDVEQVTPHGPHTEIRAPDSVERKREEDVSSLNHLPASSPSRPASEVVSPASAADSGQEEALSGNGERQAGQSSTAESVLAVDPAGSLSPVIQEEESEVDDALLKAVKIKGRPGGVAIEIGDGEWSDLVGALTERLDMAEGFFRGGRVVLDFGQRAVGKDELIQVRTLLEKHQMKLGVIRSTAEQTLQSSLEIGVASSSDQPLPERPMPQASPILPERPNHFVYQGHLRSGQVLRKSESVVVVGDINPGAQVISAGDVIVWGHLRGFVHAGATGNQRAVITALVFSPTQLRIANLTAIPPKEEPARGFWLWKKQPDKRAEVAYIADGKIVVEPWDESKPGGFTNLRR